MKKILLTIFLFSYTLVHSQEIYDYEKKIEHPENYNSQEIVINTNDSIQLYGRLITPKSKFDRILIIVSGSGPISQYAHNYLTESLLENNIGVFRFDKRGIGKSGGSTKVNPILSANDLQLFFDKLKSKKDLLHLKVGALGHSLGGLVTIESVKLGVKYDFLIQWSTPVGRPRDIVKYQIQQGAKNYDDQIKGNNLEEKLEVLEFVHNEIDNNSSKGTWEIWQNIKKEARRNGIKRNYFKNYVIHSNVEFAKLDNSESYENIEIPTLYIIGENDKLVNPISNITTLRNFENDKIEIKEFIGLNHFLRTEEVKMSELNNEIYNIDNKATEFIISWVKRK